VGERVSVFKLCCFNFTSDYLIWPNILLLIILFHRLKQVAEQSERLNEAMHEISKPLARYADDGDLDVYLKNQDRDGDPMLKFLSKKSKQSGE